MNLLDLQSPAHLESDAIIESGSFYTPRHLVDEVDRMIKPFLEGKENVIFFDSSVGGGAFCAVMDGCDFRLADVDKTGCDHLAALTDKNRVFQTNSLHDVSREKYSIPDEAYLVQVGNPPYNDTTSAYKKGEKGANECDKDLFDRDLGVSFLRSYDKLKSDLVCVLHPLAYLIKEANFKRLRSFRENYALRDGVIFSSDNFNGTSKKFPIMIGLYERNSQGMDYKTVKDFRFRILNSDKEFQLAAFTTTDGYIKKYPPGKKESKQSSIGLYYYTFRDMNALQRSASFQTKPHYNAIVVELENLYLYSWLYVLKKFFQPKDRWLYGNLSPLFDVDYVENEKKKLVQYAVHTHPAFSEISPDQLEKIRRFYSLPVEGSDIEITGLENELRNKIDSLIPSSL